MTARGRALGLSAAIALACAGASSATPQAVPADVERALGGLRGRPIAPLSAGVARYGEGSTLALKDGAILHAVSRHDTPGDPKKYPNMDFWPSVIAVTRSTDGGTTWGQPETLFRSTTGENVMQPALARLADGRIGIAYSRLDAFDRATKLFRTSADEGRTWSKEIAIVPTDAYWTSAHDRMLVLSSGRILITTHHKKEILPTVMVTRVARSDDNGRTWQLSPSELAVPEAIPEHLAAHGKRSKNSFLEASIVERADGSLLMYGRTLAGWAYRSVSRDKGVSWSPPTRTTLMSAAAPSRMVRMPGSADLLIVWNSCCLNGTNGTLGERSTLSSAISSDGGETWRWRREIEAVAPGGRVDYPAITFIGDEAFVTYRAGKGHAIQQYLAQLPIAWFYAERDLHRPEQALR